MLDPFAALGLERRFDLKPADVQQAFLTRSVDVHPDLSGGADDVEPAADLNLARKILVDPELRADALLRLLGGPTREQERGLPAGFLEEMMELRERIDAEIASGEEGVRARWESWAVGKRRLHEARAASLFRTLSEPPRHGELGAIRVELNAWRYIERLIEQLDAGQGGM